MTRVLRIRLCDEDREEYGLPEWLELDRDAFEDMRSDALHDLEDEMNLSLYRVFLLLPVASTMTRRAVAWLAIQQAGLKVPWADFNPRTMKARIRAVDGDAADPPDGTPSNDGPPDGGSSDGSTGSPSEADSAA